MPDFDSNEAAPTPSTGGPQTTSAARTTTDEQTVAPAAPVRRVRRTASRPVGPPPEAAAAPDPAAVTPAQTVRQQSARETPPSPSPLALAEVELITPTKAPRRRRVPLAATFSAEPGEVLSNAPVAPAEPSAARRQPGFVAPLFQEPDPAVAQPRRSRRRPAAAVDALGVDAPGVDAPGSSEGKLTQLAPRTQRPLRSTQSSRRALDLRAPDAPVLHGLDPNPCWQSRISSCPTRRSRSPVSSW